MFEIFVALHVISEYSVCAGQGYLQCKGNFYMHVSIFISTAFAARTTSSHRRVLTVCKGVAASDELISASRLV